MDGGDVLVVGRQVFVGLSGRTNERGVDELRGILRPWGYDVRGIRVEGCLHLKSAVTAVSDRLLVVNPAWIDPAAFGGIEWVAVAPGEAAGANVVRAGDAVVCAAEAPVTAALLEARGLRVRTVRASELAKAEGALTCCSLLFEEHGQSGLPPGEAVRR